MLQQDVEDIRMHVAGAELLRFREFAAGERSVCHEHHGQAGHGTDYPNAEFLGSLFKADTLRLVAAGERDAVTKPQRVAVRPWVWERPEVRPDGQAENDR